MYFVKSLCRKNVQSSAKEKNDSNCSLASTMADKTRSKTKGQVKGNKCAVKPYRTISIGWCHFIHGKMKQKLLRSGGGIRKVKADINTKLLTILQAGQEIFFPGGKSIEGNLEDMECTLACFDAVPFENLDVTLGEVLESKSISKLKVYLNSKLKSEVVPQLNNAIETKSFPHGGQDNLENEQELEIPCGIQQGVIVISDTPGNTIDQTRMVVLDGIGKDVNVTNTSNTQGDSSDQSRMEMFRGIGKDVQGDQYFKHSG